MNSLEFNRAEEGTQDVFLDLGRKFKGAYRICWNMYIEKGCAKSEVEFIVKLMLLQCCYAIKRLNYNCIDHSRISNACVTNITLIGLNFTFACILHENILN